MPNLKQLVAIIALTLPLSSAFAQKFDIQKFDMQKKIKTIESSDDKISYLQSFLKNVNDAPKMYLTSSQATRDSVNNHLQVDFNVLLWTVFKGAKDKNTTKLKEYTEKAYTASLQMINAGKFSKDNQLKIDKNIEAINLLLEKNKSSQTTNSI